MYLYLCTTICPWGRQPDLTLNSSFIVLFDVFSQGRVEEIIWIQLMKSEKRG